MFTVSARKLILEIDGLAPGDIVYFTATLRDLHTRWPGRFLTDVRTKWSEVLEHNPYITPIADDDPQAKHVKLDIFALLNQNSDCGMHVIHTFHYDLEDKLGIRIPLSQFKPDLHLSIGEMAKRWNSGKPYWVLNAGGKTDMSLKWPIEGVLQQVIDHFKDRFTFIQVGDKGSFRDRADITRDGGIHSYHPKLNNVVDMVGHTSIRELFSLIYQSQGVLTPVSMPMHVSAAFAMGGAIRPCVVMAGGREPSHWEQYPGHTYLNSFGKLSCSLSGRGCWKSRRHGDDELFGFKEKSNECHAIIGIDGNSYPICMTKIRSVSIIEAIEEYGHVSLS